jgi:hypothetical protein
MKPLVLRNNECINGRQLLASAKCKARQKKAQPRKLLIYVTPLPIEEKHTIVRLRRVALSVKQAFLLTTPVLRPTLALLFNS